MTDYSHSDDTGQCWTSDFAGTSVRLTVEYPDEILSGGVDMLIERRLGMKKFERIPFVLGQWIEAKGYCVPGVTIKILAEQVGVNSNCLSKYFNHTLGVTFQEWLHALRIEEAKRIIAADPSIRMSAVATAVGIPLPYNFSRWFKAVTGMTANSWRFLCRASKAEKL